MVGASGINRSSYLDVEMFCVPRIIYYFHRADDSSFICSCAFDGDLSINVTVTSNGYSNNPSSSIYLNIFLHTTVAQQDLFWHFTTIHSYDYANPPEPPEPSE